MGILYPTEENDQSDTETKAEEPQPPEIMPTSQTTHTPAAHERPSDPVPTADSNSGTKPTSNDHQSEDNINRHTNSDPSDPSPLQRKPPRAHIPQMSASTNSLTLLHNNNQPNLAHLKYFGFDSGNPTTSHPLYHNLRSLSWLQLLHPQDDPSYAEPEVISVRVTCGIEE